MCGVLATLVFIDQSSHSFHLHFLPDNDSPDVTNHQEDEDEDEDVILDGLYNKAQHHYDQLTQEERQVLANCGDSWGKAVAYPDSLNDGEIHKALEWPPPDVVRDNIHRAAGNVLIDTPAELYAKVNDALDRGNFDTAISDDEVILIVHNFHEKETYDRHRAVAAPGIPGYAAARAVLLRYLGMDLIVWQVALECYRCLNERRVAAGLFPLASDLAPLSSPLPVLPPLPPLPGRDRGQETRDIYLAMNSLYEQYKLGDLSEADYRIAKKAILPLLTPYGPTSPVHPGRTGLRLLPFLNPGHRHRSRPP